MLVQVPGGHCLSVGLPCDSIAHVELASLDSVYKEVKHVAVAWFIFFHLVELPDAMGSCGALISGEPKKDYTHHWYNLCTEFASVFELLSI